MMIFRFFLLIFLFSIETIAADQNSFAEFPLPVEKKHWSFDGIFGRYDRAQLQRGLKIYTQICAACHSLKFVSFHDLQALGYNETQIKSLAREFTVRDGVDLNGMPKTRPGQLTDHFPAPFSTDAEAALANNGIIPEDLSLIARARSVSNWFSPVTDLFTNYHNAGPDYIYALLTGYRDPPQGKEPEIGQWYNPHFIGGPFIAMAPPLYDGSIAYEDGSPETVEQYAQDVSAFLMWSADPWMEIRKQYGFGVLLFVSMFSLLMICVKRQIWRDYSQ